MTTTERPHPPIVHLPPPSLSRRGRRNVLLGLAGLVLVGGLVGAAHKAVSEVLEVADRIDAEELVSQDDAEITGCTVGPDGLTVAHLEITNDTSGSSTYVVELGFVDEDGRDVGRAQAFVDAVAPSATVARDVAGPAVDGARCHVRHVERFAA